ncbi:5'-methylthioadenosine/adenosylhomocysteine nucleosidase [Ferviditalea candida]|uniref:adenosylhomocysteine nucleosidase n=1 Tax=Ferviditalea candida TaxID=3108399 RepID=A0ABU5ZL09_9BACL|nr:5'-methylthioadenosine/adenosylhomocysteine nucleosidase [Paenibacillaceae bacterium T2]
MNLQKIGLIGAMDEEIGLIVSALQKENTTVKAGIQFHEGLFHGRRVVLCKSGVGKVNAAVCTQILIDRFGVDGILFTGVAGALDPGLNIGDIVISTECQQHDIDVTALGFPKGTIPFSEQSVFAADRGLVDLAYSVSESLFPGRSVKGRVLSGDQFIADRGKVIELHAEMNGACTEMEGAAVAQVCSMNEVPFVIIRSMSDKADGSAHVNFAEFTITASKHSFMIVEEMIRSLE